MMLHWQIPLARGDDWLTLIFLFVVVFGGLIVQFIKKLTGRREEDEEQQTPQRPPPPSRPGSAPQQQPRPYTVDAEEIRKFLEALGKPRTAPPPPPRPAAPPPLLRPVQQPPQRPPAVPRPSLIRPPAPVVAEGVSEEADEEGPRNIITGERTRQDLKPLERMDLSQQMQAVEVETLQPHRLPTPRAQVSASNRGSEFRQLLGDKTNIRRAFVLAEILSDPKALR